MKWIIVGIIGLVLAGFVLVPNRGDELRVGVIQSASHPALDLAREQFVAELSRELPHVKIVIQNGQGSLAQSRMIAQQFHADSRVVAIYAIGTPALQGVLAVEWEKPVLFSAVTDPAAAGLRGGEKNVAGVHDQPNIEREVELILQLMPAARRIGLLYNPSEVNAVSMADKLRPRLQAAGLTVVDVGLLNEAEVAQSVKRVVNRLDLLLAPTDHTVALTCALIARHAEEAGVPLFVSDNSLVARGATAAFGVDYGASGKRVAQLVAAVVRGEKVVNELPILEPAPLPPHVHRNKVSHLNLEALNDVVWIDE